MDTKISRGGNEMLNMARGGIKIIATLGPASLNKAQELADAGVDIFRLNLSHSSEGDLGPFIDAVKDTGVAACLDTQGPQVRTGAFEGPLQLRSGASVRLIGSHEDAEQGDICIHPAGVVKQIRDHDEFQLGDTALVRVVYAEKGLVYVVRPGTIHPHQAITFPAHIELPILTDFDKRILGSGSVIWKGIDCVALSFARDSRDPYEVRSIVGANLPVICKVESKAGVENLDGILSTADGILIDRGDLGRDFPFESIPFIQKHIVRQANEANVPVYVATNFLESMVKNPVPNRAEMNDIVNTLIDGADGLVLAAETAIGRYPVECVKLIRRVIRAYNDGQLLDRVLERI
jgi:pyruvate kinase